MFLPYNDSCENATKTNNELKLEQTQLDGRTDCAGERVHKRNNNWTTFCIHCVKPVISPSNNHRKQQSLKRMMMAYASVVRTFKWHLLIISCLKAVYNK